MNNINKSYYPIVFGTRIINSIGGLVAAAIIISKYTAYEAGLIYTLLSVVGLLFVLEAGLPIVILQKACRIATDVSWQSLSMSQKIEAALPTLKHYIGVAILIGGAGGSAGYFFAYNFIDVNIYQNYNTLFWLCFSLGLTLPLTTALNYFEGLGYLIGVAKVRLFQALISQSVFFMALWLKLGSASVAILITTSALVGIAIIMRLFFRAGLLLNIEKVFSVGLDWISIIQLRSDWSLQWRLWTNSIAGYFTNQAWVLGVSLTGNVILAAKVGVALQIVTAAVGFSITPIGSRLPQLAILAAADAKEKFWALSKILIRHSFITFSLVMAGVILGYGIILPLLPNASDKLLQPLEGLLLGFAIPLISCSTALMSFNQSLGRDDLYWISVLKILVPFFLIFIIGNDLNEKSIAISYLIASALVCAASLKMHTLSTKRILA